MPLKFYNTLNREKEIFTPIDPPNVSFYSCGPTVYNFAHIGNLRSYIFADILQRTLEYCGYKVKRVMNITDIGHLVSDADDGEDKMVKGLKREGKPFTLEAMKELAIFYKNKFEEDLVALNIKIPELMPFASDHIKEDVEIIQKLLEKEYAYKTSDGIYFEIEKFPDYWNLSGHKMIPQENTESRIEENKEKRNQADFVLWKFSDKNSLGYETKIGKGFPGWHIECSAMSMKYLGEQFDIHTGGIDHIPVHHTNEIAQSEAATDKKPFVRFWMHNDFLDTRNGEKMAKSGENFLTLGTITERGISPIVYRFWLLMASYRTKVNFVWEALEGAETALKRLYNLYLDLGEKMGNIHEEYRKKFKEFMEDDLDTPRALSLLWDVFKDENMSNADKKATILDFDKILGLGFSNLKIEKIPEEVLKLVVEREQARGEKNFTKSDQLRKEINSLGYEIKDTGEGQKISKI